MNILRNEAVMAEIISIIDLFSIGYTTRTQARPVPIWPSRPPSRISLPPLGNLVPRAIREPDKWPWCRLNYRARCDWHNMFSKTLFVIGLFRCVVAATYREIQPARKRNGRHFSLRILCGCSARVNVSPALWMDKHARKMLSGERTAGSIGRMCGKRLLVTKYLSSGKGKTASSIEKVTRNRFMREQPNLRNGLTNFHKLRPLKYAGRS